MALSEPILTVIIPVYNEAPTITEVLRAVSCTTYSKQIIVVDDGSSDGSIKAIECWMGGSDRAASIRLCRHPRNRGKGAAIRTGLAHAEGEIIIIQDADLECDPADYPLLVEPILGGSADVVLGSRFLEAGVVRPWDARRVFVSIANLLVWILYGRRISDEAGCYKVMRTQLLRELDLCCERFEFCPEVIAKVCRMRLVTREVSVRYRPRTHHDGKKIGWRDAAEAIFTLFWWRVARISRPECVRLAQLPRSELKIGSDCYDKGTPLSHKPSP